MPSRAREADVITYRAHADVVNERDKLQAELNKACARLNAYAATLRKLNAAITAMHDMPRNTELHLALARAGLERP